MKIDKQKITDFIIDGFNKYMNKRFRQSGIFHVSDLTKTCVRFLYYRATEDRTQFDLNNNPDFFRIIVGTQMHLIPLSENWETKLHVNDIKESPLNMLVGTIDEIYTDENGDKWILDKKFSEKNPPNSLPQSYRLQVKIYCVLARKLGFDVKGGIVSYIGIDPDSSERRFRHFILEMSEEDFASTEKYIKDMLNTAIEAIESKKIPERKLIYPCTYCEFQNKCYVSDSDKELLNRFGKKPKIKIEITGLPENIPDQIKE